MGCFLSKRTKQFALEWPGFTLEELCFWSSGREEDRDNRTENWKSNRAEAAVGTEAHFWIRQGTCYKQRSRNRSGTGKIKTQEVRAHESNLGDAGTLVSGRESRLGPNGVMGTHSRQPMHLQLQPGTSPAFLPGIGVFL